MAEIYDTLGERMKALELRFTKGEAYGSGQVVIDEHKCCIIRVDGRAFHTYTRPFAKQKIDIGCPVPARTAFHPAITGAMKYAMEALIAEFNPIVAYTQSDEITVVIGEDKVPFGRKCHKLNSIAASIATAAFNEYINTKADRSTVPEARYPSHAIFDARSYEATYEEAALTILWRHNDCVKNSISTLARSLMPQSRLVGKKSDARKEMMEQHFNVSWDDLPHGLKYGFLAYTWYIFLEAMEYVSTFIPESGDCWVYERLGGRTHADETAAKLADTVSEKGYTPKDFRIFAATGSEDIAYPQLDAQINAMKKLSDTFIYDGDGENLTYIVAEGCTHWYVPVRQYFFDILRIGYGK